MENGTVKKKKSSSYLLIILVLVIVIAGAGYFIKTRVMAKDSAGESQQSAAVTLGSIENVVTATGTLEPGDYVDVGAQVSGQLTKIYFDVGESVKKGDLLAEIDPTLFKADVDSTRAQLNYQKAEYKDLSAKLTLAEYQAKRQRSMYADGATSEENLKTAETDLLSAEAQLEMLKAQIEQTESELVSARTKLNYARIYAPMDGTVVSVSARQGQTLNANQSTPTILQIADLSVMTVNTEVSEADVSKLKAGMDAYFTTLGSQTQRWYGKVQLIEPTPTVENNVVLYNAKFDVDNNSGALLPQMTAQVSFVVASAENALIVPASAVNFMTRPGGANRSQGAVGGRGGGRPGEVQVMLADRTTETRQVRTGISNRIQIQILSGLQEGEQVILTAMRSTGAGANSNSGPPFGGMPRMH